MSNTLFRYLLMFIFAKVGFNTVTQEMKWVKWGVFLVSFINSAMVILVMGAKTDYDWVDEHDQPLLKGKYRDFTTEWFANNSSILVSNLLFNIISNIMEYVVFGIL